MMKCYVEPDALSVAIKEIDVSSLRWQKFFAQTGSTDIENLW